MAIVLAVLLSDWVGWNKQPTLSIGKGQILGFAVGLLVCAGGYFLPRVLPDRFIRTIALLIFACGVFLGLFAVVDLGFRFFDPFGLQYYPETARYIHNMVDDDDFAYIHPAGVKEVYQGAEVSINKEGLRWDDRPIQKPEGKRRLLVLGDSVVFGWGVEQDKIFPAVLEELIRKDSPDWEVVSAGAGSWNTRTEFEWLQKKGLAYQPDILLLCITSNDVDRTKSIHRTSLVEIPTNGKPTRSKIASACQSIWNGIANTSYLCGFVQHLRQGRTSQSRYDNLLAAESPEWKDAETALREMHAICQKNNVKLVATIYYAPNSELFIKHYTECLDDLGVAHTLTPDLGHFKNSRVDGHPNAEGHRVLAEHLWRFLRPQLP